MSRADSAPLRVVVVDDEPPARRLLEDAVEALAWTSVVETCADGVEAIEAIRRTKPDLVLLDVQMPEVDGFDVIEALGPRAMPEVIFVTAHQEHALRAFEVHALDYVLKPVDTDRLAEALEHAHARLASGAEARLHERLAGLLAEIDERGESDRSYARRLTVRGDERIRFVALDDVDWIETAGNYVRLHLGSETHLIRTSLKSLLGRLDPARFVRVHRSAVVNLDRVHEVQPWFSGDYVAILDTGEKLRVSRTYRDRLLKLTH